MIEVANFNIPLSCTLQHHGHVHYPQDDRTKVRPSRDRILQRSVPPIFKKKKSKYWIRSSHLNLIYWTASINLSIPNLNQEKVLIITYLVAQDTEVYPLLY